jgi:hypothetical protein
MSPAATWGLLAAWVVHDAEEWLTMPGWTIRAAQRGQRRLPLVPARFWALLPMSRLRVTVAVLAVGVLIAVAAAAGARTDGRSSLYQAVLIGFGLHSVVHVGQSVAYRGYTPGVITAVLVVAPFSWWAWHRLQEAGIADIGGGSVLTVVVLFPVTMIIAHLVALVADRTVPHRWRNRAHEAGAAEDPISGRRRTRRPGRAGSRVRRLPW